MVSIIIPCLNEARFIGNCLSSILTNGFPLEDLEILVIDAMSTDGTAEIIRSYADRCPQIRLLNRDPNSWIPHALNIGIREAKGDVLMRVDGHTTCEKDYISRCVDALNQYSADDVGGTQRVAARDETLLGAAITKALTHRIGVGNLHYRQSEPREPELVDTVPSFCCRRQLFDRIGLFNENLERVEDIEFKRRLVHAGCKIMLVPGAVVVYQARSQLGAFWKHNWSDGVWSTFGFAGSWLMPVRWRHLAPPCFVAVLIGAGVAGLFSKAAFNVFLGILACYSTMLVVASIRIAASEQAWSSSLLLPFVTFTMHLARGLGSLWGVIRLLAERRLAHAMRLVLDELSNRRERSQTPREGY